MRNAECNGGQRVLNAEVGMRNAELKIKGVEFGLRPLRTGSHRGLRLRPGGKWEAEGSSLKAES
jgi:hypothetical protein